MSHDTLDKLLAAGHIDDKKINKADVELGDDALHTKAAAKSARANELLSVTDDKIHINGEQVHDFETTVNELKEAKADLKEAGEGKLQTYQQKRVDKLQAELDKHAERSYGKIGRGLTAHDEAIEALTEAKQKALVEHKKDLETKKIELKTKLAEEKDVAKKKPIQEKIDNLSANGERTKTAIEEFHDKKIEVHKDLKTELNSQIKNIEKESGIKFADHASSKGLASTSDALKAGKTGMFEKIGKNFKTGGFSTGKAAIGSIAAIGFGVSGAKDVLTGLGVMDPGHNADGSEKESGGIFSGAAKLAAAAGSLFVAGHGGR